MKQKLNLKISIIKWMQVIGHSSHLNPNNVMLINSKLRDKGKFRNTKTENLKFALLLQLNIWELTLLKN